MGNEENKIWGIHTRDDNLFLNKNIIAIGWKEIGDLNLITADRDAFKRNVQQKYPEQNEKRIAAWSGVLYRFRHEMQVGDYVVFPSKNNREINIGRVEGDYIYDPAQSEYVQTRKVKWLKHLPRTSFSQEALNEIGSAITLFLVKNYAYEFIKAIDSDDTNEWWPKDYTPGLTIDDWVELLNDKEVFNESSLIIMKCILDYGGIATCKQLTTKYGRNIGFYNSGSAYLAKRVADKTKCLVPERGNGDNKWWPILYLGRDTTKDEDGSFMWKLRDELKEALGRIDLSNVIISVPPEEKSKYTKADFLEEVYMQEESYDRLVAVLKRKKNIILQGAPGVGKTFAATRLAYSMMGEKDNDRIEFVQFHQNYSYEDFIMGYKPVANGFELKQGVFHRFCQKAAKTPDKDYFFIIDEINRGNMSKICGELLMLIEADYRDKQVTLAYSGDSFSVPKNVYIIGMMNTADRSLAMIDYALRRRFSFFDIEPGFESDGFKKYQNDLANETFNNLIENIKELNNEIRQDSSLGKGFCIGHSYFCGIKKNECTKEWMRDVVDFDVLPMLGEYWFDENEKAQHWESKLNGVFQ